MAEKLAVTIAHRLRAAGMEESPELDYLRAWNREAQLRGELRVALRRGQFGQTRKVRLER